MLKLTAQDFHCRYAPKECDLRVHLRSKGAPEAKPGPFEQVLMELGKRHEAAHLATFPKVVDLHEGSLEERAEKTMAAVSSGAAVLYQPVLMVTGRFDGNVIVTTDCAEQTDEKGKRKAAGGKSARSSAASAVKPGDVSCEFVGIPDFLIREGKGYVIRDVKMARTVDEKHHIEITLQLQFYGWLYEQVFGSAPAKLEVFNGKGETVIVPPDDAAVLAELSRLVRLKRLAQEPYEPVGWTKCVGCGFHDHCWPKAVAAQDVALVYDLDQNLAAELHEQGIANFSQLIERFDAESLSEFKRPWGANMQKVGKKAAMILRRARVMLTKKEVIVSPPVIRPSDHYVMFDLEGMPPHLDELDKIYLWGMQVFGKTQGAFMPAVAGFGEEGDRQGWNEFLAKADAIFREFGDIPFVHWHHYEQTHLKAYVERYGDPQGVAARVRKNLLDLHPIAMNSILLPLPSYSLKVVEQYVGFKRTQDEFGGSWSMAKYIEATETQNEAERQRVMDEILLYNKEDLAATWAVFEWLRNLRPA